MKPTSADGSADSLPSTALANTDHSVPTSLICLCLLLFFAAAPHPPAHPACIVWHFWHHCLLCSSITRYLWATCALPQPFIKAHGRAARCRSPALSLPNSHADGKGRVRVKIEHFGCVFSPVLTEQRSGYAAVCHCGVLAVKLSQKTTRQGSAGEQLGVLQKTVFKALKQKTDIDYRPFPPLTICAYS